MTREEQIIEAGTYHLCGSKPPKTHGHNMHELAYISRNLSFEAGVNWADEHPKSETMNKQEFIEKTWQWLKAHIKFETISYNDVWDVSEVEILATDFATIDEMEESFRKMMEE